MVPESSLAASPDPWIAEAAERIAVRVDRELAALVGVSSPSGDFDGAEEAVAVVVAMLPDEAIVERIPCSSPGHADDLLASVPGSGRARVLLLGHLDTVHGHGAHRPLEYDGERLYGSGSIDMKGGVAISLGVIRELVAVSDRFAEIALLLVNDEEWRRHPFAHGQRFAGFDACLCFEAGELGAAGEEAVVVRRKAAATVRIEAAGRAAHSGSNPDDGRNALLALGEIARRLAAFHDPHGEHRLTVVPTVLESGSGFNVVPGSGELYLDLRADDLEAIKPVLAAVPVELEEVRLHVEVVRRWPGMDMREAAAAPLARAGELLGRPIQAGERGGASDASHLAGHVPLAIDGLGPLGAGAHAPDEHLIASSLRPRAEVAIALTSVLLD